MWRGVATLRPLGRLGTVVDSLETRHPPGVGAILIVAATVFAAVGIHFEAIVLASAMTERALGVGRLRVALAILWMVVSHLVEILVFAGGWAMLIAWEGARLSPAAQSLGDLVYFSGSVYTSLGFGDVVPLGNGRIFAVVEAVTGLVLIAWTASFTFLEMRANWRPQRR